MAQERRPEERRRLRLALTSTHVASTSSRVSSASIVVEQGNNTPGADGSTESLTVQPRFSSASTVVEQGNNTPGAIGSTEPSKALAPKTDAST